MFELQGKYNTAKVFTDHADANCIAQIQNLLNQESSRGSRIRIMPDCHAGAGCVIGTTMTVTDKVIPGLVGVDIGCGMLTIHLKEKRIDLPNLDSVIHQYVPAGAKIHEEPLPGAEELSARDLRCFGKTNCHVSAEIFLKSLGTLGGGNHFIEVDKDEAGELYLVIHTGSRRSGKDVAEFYQKAAFEKLNVAGDYAKTVISEQREEFIREMKKAGRNKELAKLLAAWKPQLDLPEGKIPYEFAYCEGELLEDYLHDMRIMQEYAVRNRAEIAKRILKKAKLHEVDRFETIHNYIDMEKMILRKGSISAAEGERVLIPINMRDGSLIAIGKGNEDWNYSAPHGAGRLMSRSEAKESISMTDYKKSMEGIYTSCVSRSTIDESAFAYKGMAEIIENIADTADIQSIIRPIYNFKAGDEA